MPDLAFLLKVSRLRFWIYLLGPYLVGLAAAAETREDLLSWRYVIFVVYFTLPANLLVYGINDIFDYETDRLNPKKSGYEALVTPEKRGSLLIAIFALNLPFTAGLIYAPLVASNTIAVFLLIATFYSAPPIRAKIRPLLDSAFNILYILPGVFGYAFAAGELPPWQAIIAGAMWTAAMHAYSAIPDIDSDRAAGIKTIATVCGTYLTIAICATLYFTSAVLSFTYLGFVSISLGLAYLLLMAASVMSARHGRLFQLYRAFPLINMLAGFIIFWQIAFDKFVTVR